MYAHICEIFALHGLITSSMMPLNECHAYLQHLIYVLFEICLFCSQPFISVELHCEDPILDYSLG
jgi:hypothetical protein